MLVTDVDAQRERKDEYVVDVIFYKDLMIDNFVDVETSFDDPLWLGEDAWYAINDL